MKILIYGLNYSPEETGIGKYSGEMGEWFAQQGHEVRAVTAPPYYPTWRINACYKNRFAKENVSGVNVYRCPIYVPATPTTVKRLAHLWSFVFTSVIVLARLLFWRPTVMINVVPTLFTTVPAYLYCKITGAKLIIHVQDFESDAMFGLGMSSVAGLIPSIWGKLESLILNSSSSLSTISDAMVKNAIAKGVNKDKVILFRNWSETKRFRNVSNVAEFRDSLILPLGKKIILYSGNIGRKQGLETMLKAAQLSLHQADLLFLIVGEGAAKTDLIEKVEMMAIDNIKFLPPQPYDKLPQLLALADVHLVIQKQGIADAVLPSKLTNIFAVGGNAVITATSETELGRLVQDFSSIAVLVKPEDEFALLGGIEEALSMEKPNVVAINYAETMLEKNAILTEYEDKLRSLAIS